MRVLTALKKKGSLESPESLGAFVNAVCNNVLLETYRSCGRADQLDDERDEPEAGEPSAEYRVLKAEERVKVREAIAALPHEGPGAHQMAVSRGSTERRHLPRAECRPRLSARPVSPRETTIPRAIRRGGIAVVTT